MKGFNHISPLKWTLTVFSIVIMGSCEPNTEPVNIYKAKPQKVNTKNIIRLKKSIAPGDSINKNSQPSIVPTNTDSNATKDTTETFQQIEKKTETKKYRRIYLYNIYKRPPVS